MDSNRIIGKLEEQGKHFETRLNRIESKMDTLLEFKWKAMGMAVVIAFIATIFVEAAKS